MRLIFIRHGDPDYENDTLTSQGHQEAEALGQYLKDKDLGEIYVSPLGRARATCEYLLKETDRKATVLPWLREFDAQVDANNSSFIYETYKNDLELENGVYQPHIAWDMLPKYRAMNENYFTMNDWRDSEVAEHSQMIQQYDWVCQGLDELLAQHGYKRDGLIYRTEQGNHDIITLVCHFGVTMVMLSHLLNVSPFVLWHGIVTAPTSISQIVTQEREKSYVDFRCLEIGATPHLQEKGFSARFCEVYEDDDRH